MRKLLRAALAAALLPLAAAAALLAAQPASAATLTQVTNFGTNPTNLNMYVYAPTTLAPKPALLLLVHYCSGSASGIFSGNGHDYVTAADRYGYLIVLPEATRSGHCFDVSSPAALRRNGGSDSTGIMSMVGWARQKYNVDPARIVVSGFSSGAMMTNVLAAEYPDVFAAASAFSGVPAGCFATSDGSLWNGQCSSGNIIRTAQQWGDTARAMYPGWTGGYPRMQLWHGTTDTTLAYPNFGEEIKQWTNLHGLGQTPGFTDHPQSSWTRTRYGATGTRATVEGVSVSGTGHTLPQSGMLAYAISFLGLDAAPTTPSPTTTPTPTTSPSPTTSPTPPASPSPTAPPPTGGAGGCRVSVAVSAWDTGLTENITVTNTGATAVNGWSMTFTLPAGQRITNGWNATYSPGTGLVTARDVGYNASIPPGGSQTVGFQADHTGNSAAAAGFTLNGAACSPA
ncbi:extracellular catalytic domain type 1 short-chain-length polyhydroxyalkanoate depolymerase [Micromonospora auratinigra]|uniref:Esterase, PHB depolymerase family n=1 Tax=Micromonospora auratinigra TaxID=261654 RepID=A0A1A8ZHP7_9ACTN|nr:PHB depolymerase family esterase [Micromonospora auratinigra]SBT43401.1 esterase, PHB depolymerase family [Micromonospora auratinigra]